MSTLAQVLWFGVEPTASIVQFAHGKMADHGHHQARDPAESVQASDRDGEIELEQQVTHDDLVCNL